MIVTRPDHRHHPETGPHLRRSVRRLSHLDLAQITLTESAQQIEDVAFDLARNIDAAQVGRLIEIAANVHNLRLKPDDDR